MLGPTSVRTNKSSCALETLSSSSGERVRRQVASPARHCATDTSRVISKRVFMTFLRDAERRRGARLVGRKRFQKK